MLAVLFTLFVYIRNLFYISLLISYTVGESIIVLLFYILNCTVSTVEITYTVLKVIYEDFGIFVLDIVDKLKTVIILSHTVIEKIFSLDAAVKWVLNDCILSLFYRIGQFLDKIFALLHNTLYAFKELLVLIGSGVWFAITLIPFSLSFGVSLLSSIIKQFIYDTCILAVHKFRRYLYRKLTKCLLTVWNKTVFKLRDKRKKKEVVQKLAVEESENACCVICRERLKCVVILPCKHLCLCTECTNVMHLFRRRCPICRTFVENTLTVYV
ncbi:PREDICTED: uncharacterized protein LOC108564480 isoform X1 [Nicrophorus vespilloides]|uniref:Uncharacterized protein LOC108564480 isoform X1 n=1 Tax=Nicrophorus vespilloides TaxID=110193 RepID=A0ABM1MWT1_NICVS|nr:PREDICTED: uncharacterized protein LOC108564480 isoform X1 [Nicrophorus vespilloides]